MSKVSDRIDTKFRFFKSELEEFKLDFKSFVVKIEKRFDKLYELIDGLAFDFKKFDEEQTVISGRQSDHSDRIDKLEAVVFRHNPT